MLVLLGLSHLGPTSPLGGPSTIISRRTDMARENNTNCSLWLPETEWNPVPLWCRYSYDITTLLSDTLRDVHQNVWSRKKKKRKLAHRRKPVRATAAGLVLSSDWKGYERNESCVCFPICTHSHRRPLIDLLKEVARRMISSHWSGNPQHFLPYSTLCFHPPPPPPSLPPTPPPSPQQLAMRVAES